MTETSAEHEAADAMYEAVGDAVEDTFADLFRAYEGTGPDKHVANLMVLMIAAVLFRVLLDFVEEITPRADNKARSDLVLKVFEAAHSYSVTFDGEPLQ